MRELLYAGITPGTRYPAHGGDYCRIIPCHPHRVVSQAIVVWCRPMRLWPIPSEYAIVKGTFWDMMNTIRRPPVPGIPILPDYL